MQNLTGLVITSEELKMLARLKRGISNIRKILTLRCFAEGKKNSELPVRDMGPFLQFSLTAIDARTRRGNLTRQQRCN